MKFSEGNLNCSLSRLFQVERSSSIFYIDIGSGRIGEIFIFDHCPNAF